MEENLNNLIIKVLGSNKINKLSFSPSIEYSKGDLVFSNGRYYISLEDVNIGNLPFFNISKWRIL